MTMFRPERSVIERDDDGFLSPGTRRLARLSIVFLIGVIVVGCTVAAVAALPKTMVAS